ncbi:MAG: indole-3-glycerol-phosphate synthase [Methanosarcinales archaeon]|nr:MAG: indole-3-glycerol-phosphate synthase [Methanosarcinales archaeon]
MLIDDIVAETKKRIKDVKPRSFTIERRDVISRMRAKWEEGKISLIAEIKPASPTQGKIRDVSQKDAVRIAKTLAEDAVALSVLTEPKFFGGSIETLTAVRNAVDIPVLRKDVIIDERQLQEVESDLILLIARVLGDDLDYLVAQAQFYGFEPIVEVHSEEEVNAALNTSTRIIGINNRDLSTLKVDLSVTEKLVPHIQEADPACFIISESGICSAEDARRMIEAGVDGILVGTAIMQDINKAKEIVNALQVG